MSKTKNNPEKRENTTAGLGDRRVSARLMATQAVYQYISQGDDVKNSKKMSEIAKEFLEHHMGRDAGADTDADTEKISPPDKKLFKNIVTGVEKELENLKKTILTIIANTTGNGNDRDNSSKSKKTPPKPPEPVLHSIMLCGIYEIVCSRKFDTSLVINDYLDIAHAFYDGGEASFVNAVLDAVAKKVTG